MTESGQNTCPVSKGGTLKAKSCEACNSSKLRCSQQLPTCSRCKKHGIDCTYAPLKRRGRPPKAHQTGSTTANTQRQLCCKPLVGKTDTEADEAAQSVPSLSLSPTTTTSQVQSHDELIATPDMTTNMDHFLSSLDFSGPEIMAWPDDDLAHCQNDMGHDPLPLEFQSAEGIDDAYPSCYLTKSENRHVTSSLSPGFSSMTDQVVSWDDNLSYGGQGATSSISPIHSGGNSPQQYKTPAQCICHPALMSLLFHRKRIRHAPHGNTLDNYRHIEGLLQWVWDLHTKCSACRDDGLVKMIWANIGNEVMCAYSKMVNPSPESHYHD